MSIIIMIASIDNMKDNSRGNSTSTTHTQVHPETDVAFEFIMRATMRLGVTPVNTNRYRVMKV